MSTIIFRPSRAQLPAGQDTISVAAAKRRRLMAGAPLRRRRQKSHGKRHGNLGAAELRRVVPVDDERELALVAVASIEGRLDQVSVARYVRGDNGTLAGIAIVIADARQRRGPGERLLRRLIRAAARAGAGEFTGMSLARNNAMLGLARLPLDRRGR